MTQNLLNEVELYKKKRIHSLELDTWRGVRRKREENGSGEASITSFIILT